MPFTTRGYALLFGWAFRDVAPPTNCYVALLTAAVAPTAATKIMTGLTEITAGNGYTQGGYSLTTNTTDFATLTEDDTNNLTKVILKTVSWTASGGNIPPSGDPAKYVVLTDDIATAASGNRLQGGGVVKSQQTGTITFTTTTNLTASSTITTVDTSKAVVEYLGVSSDTEHNASMALRVSLASGTNVVATRANNNGGTGTIAVGFSVTEYF
jgi:hypothetical protein